MATCRESSCLRTSAAPWHCCQHRGRRASTGPAGLGGGTHAVSQVLPGLGEEGQGPLACLGEPGGGGEPQHGGGKVQLSFHQHHSVGHLRAGASRLGTQSARAGRGLEDGRVGGGGTGGWEVLRWTPYPLFTASPRSYRQLCRVPFPMEEHGVAFAVRQQHDVLLKA